ncbi:MAG: glycosyltransferase family 1 protein, partial [Rhodospirillaceae bacterium]|nr:glycosyltransferase family 1 protein [Rhodospirillaceae bacterium]
PIAWDTFPGPTNETFRQNLWFQSCSYFCDVCSFSSYAKFRFWNEALNLDKGVIYLSGNNLLASRFNKIPLRKDIDVSLIGSMYKSRERLLNYLRPKLASAGISLSHFGGAFDETKAPAQDGTTSNWLSHEDYVNIINRSKIVLCPGGADGQWAVRGKIFEFMSCGAFCLVEENPDITKTIPEETLSTYANFEECLQKILYYMAHEEEREESALASRLWYQETYNSSNFWKDFLSGVVSGQTEFKNTPFVEENYQRSRVKFLESFEGIPITPEKIMRLELDS